MEHSASLRSLEASGRPSGTGRPSLPPPRNDFSPSLQGEGTPAPSVAPAEPNSVFDLLVRAPLVQTTLKQGPLNLVSLNQAPLVPTAAIPGVTPAPSSETGEEPPFTLDSESELEVLLEGTWLLPAPTTALPLPVASPVVPLLPSSASAPAQPQLVPDLVLSLEPKLVEAELVQTADTALVLDSQAQLRGTELVSPKLERAEFALPEKETVSVPARPEPAPRAAEILQQMRVNLNATTRSAVIQLSPPELGWITVQIRMEEDKLRTLVRAERPEALDALTRHLPELRATLQQQGIQVNDIQLELGLGPRGESREDQQQRPSRRAFRHDASRELAASEEALLARVLTPRVGGVDTYA